MLYAFTVLIDTREIQQISRLASQRLLAGELDILIIYSLLYQRIQYNID